MSALSTKKQLDFLQSILADPGDFRPRVVDAISRYFGYKKMIFWMSDSNGNLYNPVSSINEGFVADYARYYHQKDVLYPTNIGVRQAINDEVICRKSIQTDDNFKQSEYYDFLRKHNLHDESAIYLNNCNTIIGCIGIGLSPNEPPFTSKIINELKNVTIHMSSRLSLEIMYSNEEFQKKFFEAFANQSTNGLIIFDRMTNIHYYNRAAKEICKMIAGKNQYQSTIDYFVKNIMTENMVIWNSGFKKTILSPSLIPITIFMAPITTNNHYAVMKNNHELFMICLFASGRSRADLINNNSDTGNVFTKRELEVISLLIKGHTNQEIATKLFVSIHSVKKHLRSIFKKMDVSNRTSLMYKISESSLDKSSSRGAFNN